MIIRKKHDYPGMTGRLLDIEQKSLQILPFRMINIDSVICRLVQTVENSHTPAGLRRCRKHRKRKSLLIDHLRTTVSKHQSARSYLRYCRSIQSLICPERVFQSSPMLCESGRIHDDQIIFSLRNISQIIYGVTTQAAVLRLIEPVEPHILVHKTHSLFGAVHRIYRLRTCCQSID